MLARRFAPARPETRIEGSPGACRAAVHRPWRRSRPAIFSDGITEDITDRLTRFRGLTVIGLDHIALRQTPHRTATGFAPRSARDFTVSGSIRRADSRICIAVHLTETAIRASIRAEQYDRPLVDLFGLQDEVSERVDATIARQLEVELSSRSVRRPRPA